MESSIFLSAIVAMTKDRVIGDGKRLMWNLPEDLKNLKLITMGSPLIMGRKTWDSIGKPLPGRANIVLTKNVGLILNGAQTAVNLIAVFKIANNWILENNQTRKEIFLFGGSQVYQLGLQYCKYLYITEVNLDVKGEVLFPEIKKDDWEVIYNSGIKKSKSLISYEHYKYKRKAKINLKDLIIN